MKAPAARASLRFRLLAGTVCWIAASLVAAAWGLSTLFRQHVETQFHAALQTHLDQLTALLAVDGQGHPALRAPLSDPRLRRPYSGLYWQIDAMADPPVVGLLRSRSLWDHALRVPTDDPADGQLHRHRLPGPNGHALGMIERSVRLDTGAKSGENRFRLIVAADEDLLVEPVTRFNGALGWALGVLGAGLVAAASVQVWIGLAPLRKLRAALGRVRSGDSPALAGEFPAEVMPLVEDFNSVLAENAAVVERARTQAGNLAHALKTPLSVLANAAAGKDDELARLVVAQVDNARQQVHFHLARAQAAAALRIPGARTSLSAVLDGLLRTMRHLHAARQLEFRLSLSADEAVFRGEQQDLQEMLGNLLDNACKWARSRVDVAAERNGPELTVRIDDDGPGIAVDTRAAVLQRGVRADQQTPGNGLGLAIVADLAELHGGRLQLADSPLGGLSVVLVLPAARPAGREAAVD